MFLAKKTIYCSLIIYKMKNLRNEIMQGLFYEEELAKTDFCQYKVRYHLFLCEINNVWME